MTEPAPYTEDDVALVAAATEQHYIVAGRTDAMGNSPCVCDQWNDAAGDNPGWDQHMAEVTLAALANAGRPLPEGTRWPAALHAEADRVHALGGEYNEAVAVGVRAAARMISEGSPEDTRTEEWSFLYRDGNVDGRRYAGEAAARQYAEAFDGTPVRRWVGPWAPVPEPDPDMSTAPNPSVGAHFEAHSAHIPDVPEEELA